MWSSAISYQAKPFATTIRESLESLNYVFIRDMSSKSYSRFVIMIPMMSGAHVYRYTVDFPSPFIIQCYDTYPGTKAGLMPMLEIDPVTDKNRKDIARLLEEINDNLERPPWEFSHGQRLMVGYLLPEFSRARKSWKEFGFDTSRKATKERKKERKAREKERKMAERQKRAEAREKKGEEEKKVDGPPEELERSEVDAPQ